MVREADGACGRVQRRALGLNAGADGAAAGWVHTHCHTDWRVLVGGGAVGLALWAGGLSVAYSYQMSETPLVRNLVFMLRHDAQVHELLGDRVRAGFWYSGTFNDFKVRRGVCRTKRQQRRPCLTIALGTTVWGGRAGRGQARVYAGGQPRSVRTAAPPMPSTGQAWRTNAIPLGFGGRVPQRRAA